MTKILRQGFLSLCLVSSLALSTTTIAGGASARVAKTSCTTMGLTPASLRALFGTVTFTSGGYECGFEGSAEVTLYLYPLSQKAAALKADGVFRHPKRLGGLGAGADFEADGSGSYRLNLTSGTHFVYILGQYVPTQAKLIALAHIIYRALA
jgi:hypothetical protein